MNRKYAFGDYQILVTAHATGDQPGWRPEICLIAPDERWEFVPTHEGLVAQDPARCLELGRLFGENAIRDQRIDEQVEHYSGYWH